MRFCALAVEVEDMVGFRLVVGEQEQPEAEALTRHLESVYDRCRDSIWNVLDDLVTPLDVRPEQFVSAPRSPVEGEKRLMLAILDDSIRCFYGIIEPERNGKKHVRANARWKERMRAEAEEWFRSTDTSHIFAFEICCEHLGIDAGRFRAKLFAGELNASQRGRGLFRAQGPISTSAFATRLAS
jgi:hypothetical protein